MIFKPKIILPEGRRIDLVELLEYVRMKLILVFRSKAIYLFTLIAGIIVILVGIVTSIRVTNRIVKPIKYINHVFVKQQVDSHSRHSEKFRFLGG